jgi:hypothetical protein
VFTPPRNGSFAPVAAGAAALLLLLALVTLVLVVATAVEVWKSVVDEMTVGVTLVLDDTGGLMLAGAPWRHWEYQSLLYVHVQPLMQVVGPAKLLPPPV